VACGAASSFADVVIASGNGAAGIRAVTASSLGTSSTVNYGGGFGPTWQFASFTGASFAAARSGGLASLVTTNLPGSAWNNGSNNSDSWTGANSAVMNGAHARWISSGSSGNPSPVTSVLFAIPFYVGSNTVADIRLTFVTDNGLGSINGANNTATPLAQRNGGLFLNGSSAQVSYTGAPGGGGQPGQFGAIQQTGVFHVTSLIANSTNWLYFHQFNWGTFGGSAFVANIQGEGITMVPLPAPVWGGIGGLAGVGCIAAIRRRRMA
jgi:hypothetical protein